LEGEYVIFLISMKTFELIVTVCDTMTMSSKEAVIALVKVAAIAYATGIAFHIAP